MLECVMNVSEGRQPLDPLLAAAGDALLDVHTDPDHHRSVLTLAGPMLLDAAHAARRVCVAAAAELDLRDHVGVHPRHGAIDVVPFVALHRTPPTAAVDAALLFADWAARELAVPVFLYGDASPDHASLPEVRRDAFTVRAPDRGPRAPHPRLGAICVGARPVLVAVNVELDCGDVALARTISREVRERDGGLPGVRALGLALESRGHAQVSMNLVDLERTGVEAACVAVRTAAARRNTGIDRVELVGLMPEAELTRCSAAFLSWSGLRADQTIEARLAAVAAAGEPGAGRDSRA